MGGCCGKNHVDFQSMHDFDMPSDEDGESLDAPPNKLGLSIFRKKQKQRKPVVKNPMLQQTLSTDASNDTLEAGSYDDNADRTGLSAKGKFPKRTSSAVANPMLASTSSPEDESDVVFTHDTDSNSDEDLPV